MVVDTKDSMLDKSKRDRKRSLKVWKAELRYLQIGILNATEKGMPKHVYART